MKSKADINLETTTVEANMRLPISILINHFEVNPNSLDSLLKDIAEYDAYQLLTGNPKEAKQILSSYLLESAKEDYSDNPAEYLKEIAEFHDEDIFEDFLTFDVPSKFDSAHKDTAQ